MWNHEVLWVKQMIWSYEIMKWETGRKQFNCVLKKRFISKAAIVSTGDSDPGRPSPVDFSGWLEIYSRGRPLVCFRRSFFSSSHPVNNVVQPSKMLLADPLEPATSIDSSYQMLSAEAPCPVARGWITYTPAIHQWCTVTSRVFGCPVLQFRRRVGCSRLANFVHCLVLQIVFILHRSTLKGQENDVDMCSPNSQQPIFVSSLSRRIHGDLRRCLISRLISPSK